MPRRGIRLNAGDRGCTVSGRDLDRTIMAQIGEPDARDRCKVQVRELMG
jgi:hypothetical protein